MYSYPLYPTSISDSPSPNSAKIEAVFQIIDKRTFGDPITEFDNGYYEWPSITGYPTYFLSMNDFFDNIINAQSFIERILECRSEIEQTFDMTKNCYHVHILLLDNPKEEEPPKDDPEPTEPEEPPTENTPEEGATDAGK